MPSEPGTIPNFYTVKIIKHIPQAKKDMRYGTSLQKAICKLEITNLLKDTVVLLLSWAGLGLQLGPGWAANLGLPGHRSKRDGNDSAMPGDITAPLRIILHPPIPFHPSSLHTPSILPSHSIHPPITLHPSSHHTPSSLHIPSSLHTPSILPHHPASSLLSPVAAWSLECSWASAQLNAKTFPALVGLILYSRWGYSDF